MTSIAQVSDMHVRPEGMLYQSLVDSNAMFLRAVVALNSLEPAPDVVLFTGDLTDDESPEAYAMLRELLGGLIHPYVLMPGNHDDRGSLREAFSGQPWWPDAGELNYGFDVGPVRVLAVDTTVPGFHHGELSQPTLAWLGRELGANADRRIVIAMHHPPFDTGIPYLDRYGLREVNAFAQLVSRYRNIDRIIAGHVHRAMHSRLGTIPVSTCPSTTTQIALRLQADAKPASYMEPPAFMLHRWNHTSGNAVSHLCYVDEFDGPMSFA
nr:phosphodiesterase [uncultured Cupriavidus sp.]